MGESRACVDAVPLGFIPQHRAANPFVVWAASVPMTPEIAVSGPVAIVIGGMGITLHTRDIAFRRLLESRYTGLNE